MQRTANLLKKPITSTIIAVVCGFIVAGIILAISGYNPIEAFVSLFRGIFSRPKYIFKVIEKSTPIILTGISVAFAFKTGLFNIGSEGQFIAGSIASVVVGVKLNMPPIIQIPTVILAGVLAGALFGAIAGFLKAKFGINEVITSIMLNWIAFYLCNFVVDSDAFHKPNTVRSLSVNESSYTMILYKWKNSKEGISYLKHNKWLSDILLKTDLNWGFIIAILVAFLISFLLYKTTMGYSVRAVGLNRHAAEFAGIGVKRNIVLALTISGAICGLAAALVITGTSPHAVYKLSMFEGNGLNGLFVALIAGSAPIGCIFSGLFFAALNYGGNSMQMDLGIPSEIINITIGTILFFVALTQIIPIIADKLEKRSVKNVK